MQCLLIYMLCVFDFRTQATPEECPAGTEEKQTERLLQNPRGG